jgi:diguanylate cyclase (GGDEF)-like protein
LVLAFVDVDNLKGKNDSLGHGAGDRLLRRAADSIRASVRSYDLLIRYGGDEFLCALPGLTLSEAAERFSRTNADLAAAKHEPAGRFSRMDADVAAAEQEASVTVGLAELAAGDTLTDLIERADKALYAAKASGGT